MEVLEQKVLNQVIPIDDQWHTLRSYPDQPYMRILSFDVVPVSPIMSKLLEGTINMKYEAEYHDGQTIKGDFLLQKKEGELSLLPISQFEAFNVRVVRLKCKHTNESEIIKAVSCNYLNRRVIDTPNEKSSFKDHLDSSRNTKILFSAPFGEGKSTFLDYFFEEQKNQYEVFKVFPVDYSIASNEDIFRYIKTDILLQLLNNVNADFDELDSKNFSFRELVLPETQLLIEAFVSLALSIDSDSALLVPAVDKFSKLIEKIRGSIESNLSRKDKNGDLQSAVNYIQKAYEREGSIYEDNFHTQLIRQLIDQLKEESAKQSVLVIDDLDRMDPDHIFRILNVISAHYDRQHLYKEEYNNKFGFDKIILVCDIENIRQIFHHRYGPSTDFRGYINKFFSTGAFRFNNKYVTQNLIEELKTSLDRSFFAPTLNILNLLVISGLFSLRDFIKIRTKISTAEALQSYLTALRSKTRQHFLIDDKVHTAIILALGDYFGSLQELIKVFELCKSDDDLPRPLLWNFDRILASVVSSDDKQNNSKRILKLDHDRTILFELQTDSTMRADYAANQKIETKSGFVDNQIPTIADLCHVLILNTEKIAKIISQNGQ